MGDFLAETEATIARWHGVVAPNQPARRMAADLAGIIAEFEALRGTLRLRGRTLQLRSRIARHEGGALMAGLADLSLVEAADAVRNGDATSLALLDGVLGQPGARSIRR